MNGKGDKWRGGWSKEYESNHNDIFKKEKQMNKELIREAVYGFIAYYTTDELERLDLRFVADKYVDEEYETNPRGEK